MSFTTCLWNEAVRKTPWVFQQCGGLSGSCCWFVVITIMHNNHVITLCHRVVFFLSKFSWVVSYSIVTLDINFLFTEIEKQSLNVIMEVRLPSRWNGFSLPLHPLQFLVLAVVIFFDLVWYFVNVPQFPLAWQPAGYTVSFTYCLSDSAPRDL